MKWSEVLAIFVAPKESSPGAATPERGGGAAIQSGPPSSPPMGDLDLTDIYRQKGISADFTAEQALELLDSLPKGLRGETMRQALIDLLEEKNPTFLKIVTEDARKKVDLLIAVGDSFTGEFVDFVTDTKDEIVKMEAEIREKQKAIEQAQAQAERITQQCRAEAERLKALLQFLG